MQTVSEAKYTYWHSIIGSTKNRVVKNIVYILVQRNHNSGNLEISFRDTGNHLNSAALQEIWGLASKNIG